jgi:hypothetical protein
VFQVRPDGAFGQAEPPGDLGVGMPGGEQVKQLPVPGGEHRDGMAAAFGVEVSLVQMRAQQGEQVALSRPSNTIASQRIWVLSSLRRDVGSPSAGRSAR